MSLIDRYVAEVGRHLPGAERADIEAEIRSTLEDMIEESAQDSGSPADQKQISAVLRQFGDPELLAQKYTRTKRYLIGRRWYELYMGILKRVLAVALPVSLLIQFFVKYAATSENLSRVLLQSAGATLNIGVHIWFWITVTFVILEHSGLKPSELDSGESREWTPEQLPQLPRPRQIGVGDVVTDIILTLGGMAFVAFSTSLLRISGDAGNIPLLHPDLWKVWLPLFFVLSGLTLVHELFKLRIENWTPALTITNVILGLVAIGYLLGLVFSQGLLNPAFLAVLESGGVTPELRQSAEWTIGITVAIIIGCYAWSIYNSIIMAKRLSKQGKP
ncbi:MAG: hypothetical protein AB1649_09785 [Chloroflexota bacterium]